MKDLFWCHLTSHMHNFLDFEEVSNILRVYNFNFETQWD